MLVNTSEITQINHREQLGPFNQKLLYIVLLNADNRKELLESLPSEAFSIPNVWLILDQDRTIADHNIYFPIDSQVLPFYTLGQEVIIEDIYKISPSSPSLVSQYGTWRDGAGINLPKTPLFERRKDLQGHVFRGQTVNEPPYVVVDMDALDSGKVDRIDGIMGEIWHDVLERSLNFSTELRSPKDRQWGALGQDGRWGSQHCPTL